MRYARSLLHRARIAAAHRIPRRRLVGPLPIPAAVTAAGRNSPPWQLRRKRRHFRRGSRTTRNNRCCSAVGHWARGDFHCWPPRPRDRSFPDKDAERLARDGRSRDDHCRHGPGRTPRYPRPRSLRLTPQIFDLDLHVHPPAQSCGSGSSCISNAAVRHVVMRGVIVERR